MNILKTFFAVIIVSLAIGCESLRESRREEVAQNTKRLRHDIQQLVSEHKYSQACSYSVPYSRDFYVNCEVTRIRDDIVANIVYPAWAEYECAKLKSKVEECLAKHHYAEAREYVWCAEKIGITSIDERVSALRRKLLTGDINMSELEYARKYMCDITDKAIQSGNVSEIVAARKALNSYPQIRTYTEKLDVRLNELVQAMKLIGVSHAKSERVLAGLKKKLSDCFIDEQVSFKKNDSHDTSNFFARWEDFKSELGKYGCSVNQVKDIAAKCDKILKYVIEEAADISRGPAEAVELGTTAVIERLNDTRTVCLNRLLSCGVRFATDELIADVQNLVSKKNFIAARNRIIEAPAFGDRELDTKFYRVRIGVLNSSVNPMQCAALIAELQIKVDKEIKANNFEGAEKVVFEFHGIDDRKSYAKLFETMKSIRDGMRDLAISDSAADAYIGAMTARALNQINSQEFNETVERDYTKLSTVIREFALTYGDIVYDNHEGFRFAGEMYNTIMSGMLPVDEKQSFSTHVANIRIDEFRVKMLDRIQKADKNYTAERNKFRAEYTAKVRRERLESTIYELDHVSETAAAVKAIEMQLSENPEGTDSMGPVLGEYARLMRKWHDGDKSMTDDEALTIISGAIYLNKPEIFGFARDNISSRIVLNTAPQCDPLGRTPLLLALKFHRQDFVRMLIENDDVKIDGSIRDAHGNSLLHYFAEGASRKQLDLFKKYIAVDTTTNNVGETALFSAAKVNNAQMIDAVVGMIEDDNADRQAAKRDNFIAKKNSFGETAFTVAAREGSCEAMVALKKLGAVPTEKDLAAAASGNHLEAVKWLVERGVKINVLGSGGAMAVVPTGSDTEKYLMRQGGIKVIRSDSSSKSSIKLEATLHRSVDTE